MSREAQSQISPPIQHIDELLEIFQKGAREPSEFKLGLETEKIGVNGETGEAIPFEGPGGIEDILKTLAKDYGWTPITDQGRVIALSQGDAAITLEPGGQLELSGAPFRCISELRQELETHLSELRRVSDPLGVRWLALGIQPMTPMSQARWVPKSRYKIMRGYYEGQNRTHALEMMTLTAATQINLDYHSEADARDKVRLGTVLAPLVSGILANSCFDNGAFNGVCSRRLFIWLGTDTARCGAPDFFSDGSFTFERYRDYALDVPMYFVYRQGRYIDYTMQTFRQVLAQGQELTQSDWVNHLTTLFPDVRLKNHLEYRTADAGSRGLSVGLAAFWRALAYDEGVMQEVLDRFSTVTPHDQRLAMVEAAKFGMAGMAYGKKISQWAQELLPLVYQGLPTHDHDCISSMARVIERGYSPAECVRERFKDAPNVTWKCVVEDV